MVMDSKTDSEAKAVGVFDLPTGGVFGMGQIIR